MSDSYTAQRGSSGHPNARRYPQPIKTSPVTDGPPSITSPMHYQPQQSMASFRMPHQPTRSILPRSHSINQKPKVAIPRLRRDSDAGSAAGSARGEKHRVRHACESCRVRKVRCSGGEPRCDHCKEHELDCVYGDGKRDRAKRELSNLREKVDEYEAFLRQLTSEVDPSAQVAIERLLANSGSSALPSPATGKRRRPETEVDGDATANFEGEHLVSAEVGSVGSLDKCHEDINRDDSARTAGFFGKITDVAWITRVKDQLMAGSASDTKHGENLLQDDGPQLQRPYGPDAKNVLSPGNNSEHGPIDGDAFKNESWTYNLDDCDLGLPDRLNQLDLPPRRVADQLVDAYFTTVHPSFPLLLKRSFWQLYEQSFEAYHHPISDQDRAILNLVLAIGAKYAVVTRAGICDDRDHLAFFSKARSLSLDNGLMWHTGDLQQVQVAGLAASYLMAIGHTNRAWYMSGLAVRYAQGLALHLRNDSSDMTYVQHEIQVRIWWSVYSLERLLGVMTGRPSAIHDEDVSTLLPDATDEDSFPADNGDLNDGCFDSVAHGNREPSRHAPTPNNHFRRTSQNQSKSPSNKISSRGTSLLSSMSSSSPLATPRDSETSDSALVTPNKATYFVFRIRMNKIMHHILTSLYSASTVQHSWADVQQFIRGNEAQFARWRSDLPTAFNFSDPHQDQSFARERLGLGLLYWSCNILVYRPCLCRLEGKITEESSKSKDFNQKAARDCVNAARNLLALLPDENDMVAFLYLCPWWSILHYLMQAVVVLIIELKMQVCHLPNGLEVVLKDTQKALRLLRFMAKGDVAASRACRLIDKLLRLVEPQIGHNLSKLTPHGRSRSTRPNVPLPPSDTHHSRSYLPFEGLQDQNGFLSHFNLNSVDGRSSPDRDHFYSTFMHSIFDQDVQFPAGTSSMFPTESQMNFLNEDETDSHMADGMGH